MKWGNVNHSNFVISQIVWMLQLFLPYYIKSTIIFLICIKHFARIWVEIIFTPNVKLRGIDILAIISFLFLFREFEHGADLFRKYHGTVGEHLFNSIHVFFLIITVICIGGKEGERGKHLRYIGFSCDFCGMARHIIT